MTITTGTVYNQGDKAQRSVTVNGQTVTIKHVSQSHDGRKVYMENTIDFSDESGDDILKWAANSVLIGVLRKRPWNGLNAEAMIAQNNAVYKPCDWPANRKVKLTPEQQLANAFTNMDETAKMAFLQEQMDKMTSTANTAQK